MRVGVIGLGIVGETIFRAMKFYHEKVKGYDKFKPSDGFRDVLETDIVFVSVPTDEKNGVLDGSIILGVLEELEVASYKGVVCIKSTIGLNFLNRARTFNLRIVYSPEFLHEKSRLADFISPDHVVISGEKEDIETVRKALYWIDDSKFFIVGDRTAELTKLAINAYAATKISFSNEIAKISGEVGADAVKVMEILRHNKRCAPEYTDPTRGPYSGKCLPKDIRELINSTSNSILFKAVEEVNERLKKNLNKK